MNLRNCGDTMHLANTFYNAGLSGDVREVIRYCSEELGHKKIFIVGFSLGANTVLKLAGELKDEYPPELAGVCAVSPPLDLSKSASAIIKPKNIIYDRYYLNRMRRTYKRKKEYFPDLVNLALLDKIRNLYDFDNYITGPGFNYKDAEDYYENNSSGKFLEPIKVKTLIIQAKDDPIIPPESTEKAIALANPNIEILFTDFGGHVGFINSSYASKGDIDRHWAENRIVEFVESNMTS
jgi:predicted alpha/beta-fold hydrolase